MWKFHSIGVFGRQLTLVLLTVSAHGQTGGQTFQTTTFGMIGMTQNQVARLNVLNPGNTSIASKPVCSAELEFLDSEGKVLKSSNGAVDEGKSVSLELDRTEAGGGAGRVEIRAVVKTSISRPDPSTQFPIMPGSVCSFFPTVEIFEKDTGKTVLVMSEGRSFIAPIPANGVPGRLIR